MITIVGVKFRSSGKVYYFDPGEFEIREGSHVIVETARGLEYGEVTAGPREITEKSVVKPLRKVVRIANEEDETRHRENQDKKQDALEKCQKKIEEHKLDMKLIDVEYTFDHSKIIFYFTADGRVDFRDLVRDLASIFRMRIELRQVGVRDEARMLGGIGACGKPFCCHTWLGKFNPVSIKMAKTQGLSLNPAKISGICGRLMCCLKYENDTYCELKRGMPDQGETVRTPEGPAVVVDTDILQQTVKVRHIERKKDGKRSQEEELSSDITVYAKDEITLNGSRRRHKAQNDASGESPESMPDPED